MIRTRDTRERSAAGRAGTAVVMSFLLAGCAVLATPGASGNATPGASGNATPRAVATPRTDAGPGSARPDDTEPPPPDPTRGPVMTDATCGPDQAWIGVSGGGAACLDATGWTTFDSANSPVALGRDPVIAVCGDGTAWIADTDGLHSTDGRSWESHGDRVGTTRFDAVACDPAGGVWLVGYKTVGHYDGRTWTTHPVAGLGTGEYVGQVRDVAVGPDGHVWVTTATSIAAFDGTTWKYWDKGAGLKDGYDLGAVEVDAEGVVWATVSGGFLRFDGRKWTEYRQDFPIGVKVTARDARGRLWAGTYANGLAVWSGKGWRRYTTSNSALPSNNIRSIAFDGTGRTWVGTDWGLAILDGSRWKVYHMSDADLPDNDIHAVAVAGKGPPLPAPAPKEKGRLTGRLVLNGVPQAGLAVEACVQLIGDVGSGATPCEDQAFRVVATTGSDGRFSFTLPVGRYTLVARSAAGKWLRLADEWRNDKRLLVTEGGVLDLRDISVRAGE